VKYDVAKAFGAIARIHQQSDALTPKQQARLDQLVERYCAKTRRSKAHTQEHRARHADPRVVSGFKPRIKELVYPIVTERAKGVPAVGPRRNVYVDALNGFGSNFFGYSPPFIARALHARIDAGFDVGPQTPLAGEAAALVCELTGMDRAAFCNTARGRDGRAADRAHGDRPEPRRGVLGVVPRDLRRGARRDTRTMRSVPAAPGIMPESVQNILVLEYGTDASLAVLRERADEIAAVLVEPVQSRRPDFQPREFLHALRALTREAGAALIFDEVITGFRAHPGGAQAHFGVEADLAAYGKVVGGGMPIGVVAGRDPWMDALDGGVWQFGDDSVPTAGVTYFAGTFVRHPLAMQAAVEALRFMKAEGPALQERVNAATSRMAAELNAFFASAGAPLEVRHFASLWKTSYTEPQPYGELLFCHLRDRGVHIWDGFPCFLTIATARPRCASSSTRSRTPCASCRPGTSSPAAGRERRRARRGAPPVPGARLGRDPQGMPAWFVPNPDAPGKYLQLT
jgi:glutamate-1-semialdehyde aminotransferase